MVKQHSTLKNTPRVNGPLSLPDASKQRVCDCTCLCGWKRGAGCAPPAIGIKPDHFNAMPCTCDSLLFELSPPFTHCRKGGRLQCRAMHMLRACVSSISCILLANLPRKEMPRSTAASAGQYVRSNDKTRQTFTRWRCSRSGVKASHIRDMGVLAKV